MIWCNFNEDIISEKIKRVLSQMGYLIFIKKLIKLVVKRGIKGLKYINALVVIEWVIKVIKGVEIIEYSKIIEIDHKSYFIHINIKEYFEDKIKRTK